MKPRNCDECKYTNNCNSAFGGLGCKYNIKPVLAMILVLAFGMAAIVTSAKAEEQDIPEEVVVIDAEDIGIKTIEADQEEIHEETEPVEEYDEPEEEVEYEEAVTHEAQEEEPEPEASEPVKEEVEAEEPPAGLVEGYKEGVYFTPNCFDCELHEYCYICPECTIEEKIGYDEEINPNGGYYLDKTCIVCGHGTCTTITEEELEALSN